MKGACSTDALAYIALCDLLKLSLVIDRKWAAVVTALFAFAFRRGMSCPPMTPRYMKKYGSMNLSKMLHTRIQQEQQQLLLQPLLSLGQVRGVHTVHCFFSRFWGALPNDGTLCSC